MKYFNSNKPVNIFSLIVCFCILLGQTACSSSSHTLLTDEPLNQSTQLSNQPTDLETDIGDQHENQVITFTAFEFESSYYEPLIEQFNAQNPTITVKFIPFPAFTNESQHEYYQRIASAADATMLLTGRSSQIAAYFRDLQPLIDLDAGFDSNDFWPDALSACQDDQGYVFGLPVNLYMSGIFYDEEAFQAAKISFPQPGWTWDDFQQAAFSLAHQEEKGIYYGFADPTYASIISPILKDHFLKMNGNIDPQVLAKELFWYVDLAKQSAIYPIQGLTGDEKTQLAEENWKALFQGMNPPAMWFGRLQDPVPGLAGIVEDNDPSTHLAVTRFGFAPLPVASDNPNSKTTPLSAQCIMMSAGTKYPQATWNWIKFLSEQRLIHDSSQLSEKLVIPARSSVADKSGFWDSIPVELHTAIKHGLTHGWYKGLYPEAEAAVYSALEHALLEGEDLLQALNQAQTEIVSLRSEVQPSVDPIVIETPHDSNSSSGNIPIIKFYAGSGNHQEIEFLQTIVANFNSEYADAFSVSLVTTIKEQPNQGYFETLAKSSDCYITEVDPVGAATSGYVLNLTPFFETEDNTFRNDYDKYLLDISHYQGKLFSLPLTSRPPILVYNTDLLRQNGVEEPDKNWTFDDLIEKLTAITSITNEIPIYGFLPESQAVNIFDMILSGNNIHWLDDGAGLPVAQINTREMVNIIQWYQNLYQTGVLFTSSTDENWLPSIQKAIQDGQIGFWTVLTGEEEVYFDGKEPAFNIGITALPFISEPDYPYSKTINTGFYISSQSQNQQACWLFAKYLSEEPSLYSGIPARKSVANSPAWMSSVGVEKAEIYLQALQQSQPAKNLSYPDFLLWPYHNWLGQVVFAVKQGHEIQQELAAAQQKADAYYACIIPIDWAMLNEEMVEQNVIDCAKKADASWN
jgi:ABC-type glycerol-3-phosphate transport system substrate-binding protein